MNFNPSLAMTCPFCHQIMEHGRLRSKGGVFFLPDGEKVPKLYTDVEMKKRNVLSLPPHVFDSPPRYPEAFLCRSCGKIILDISAEA